MELLARQELLAVKVLQGLLELKALLAQLA
jgi:hypothetical protein